MKILSNICLLIRDGDEAAFRALYEARSHRVFNSFLKKRCSEDDAKDLMQDTFLKLWKYRQSMSNEYNIDQYLFRIAKTIYLDYLRRESSLREKNKRSMVYINRDYCYSKEETCVSSLFSTALSNGMSEMRKRIFIMNRIEGYSYKEISDKLNISVKSVDNHLHRAIKQFKEILVEAN